jgi:hypothetical protein
MAESDIPQAEADALLKLEKKRIDDTEHEFPILDGFLAIPLRSLDEREHFSLDIRRGRIALAKVTYQNRARQTIILARLDLGGPPHRNPNGEEIGCPHLHLYREGYGDKWAYPMPASQFEDPDDLWQTLQDFLAFCNVTVPPNIRKGLF